MSVRGVALASVVGVLSACVYYNALYNAEQAFAEGERHRLAGRDSLAAARFRDVVRKAARGYRAEPSGPWSDDAMLLVGRAHLRLGDHRAGRAALRAVAERSEDPQVRLAARLHLASSFVQAGDPDAGVPLLNEAIQGVTDEATRAEGHLWRGRALMELGQVDGGWWDLDQAGALHRSVRLSAALEKVQWGIVLDEPVRVQEGMSRIFSLPEGGDLPDTVAWLARQAARRWGPTEGARLLAAVDSASWSRPARARVRLVRADLMVAAGDTSEARFEIEAVAGGRGPTAVEARLRLARQRLSRALDVPDVQAVASILLPSERDPDVARLLSDVLTLTALADLGLSEPLAWFLAAELARDRLDALDLARAFFLTYADVASGEPWAAKALLAALDVTRDEGERAWLRGRLEGRADSPYVLAARGEPAPGIEALEGELARRMQEISSR